ncbi:hypothetical protein BH11PLA1_BH11PLA1_17670 [soil metagenome]
MNFNMLTCSVAALSLSAGAALAQYSNNFNVGPIGPEWSNPVAETAPGGERFLGGFVAGTVTLNLGVQPAGIYTIDFDFYGIRSLDGNGPAGGGPDPFAFAMNTAQYALTNFDNFGTSGQMYPSLSAPANNAAGTGAIALNSLGYTFGGAVFADSIYHLSHTGLHTGGVLTFEFTSFQNQGYGDEGWGLDNVVVIPTPGAAALLIGAGLLSRRRR